MKIVASLIIQVIVALVGVNNHSLLNEVGAQQIDEVCADGSFALDFTACLLDNACVCSNCDDLDDPDIDAAIEANGGTGLTCAQVNELWCPWVRCCSDCSESRQTYLQCTFIGLYSGLSLVEEGCQLDCGSYPANDVEDEDCVDGCGQEWADHVSCRIDNCNDAETTQCEADNDQDFSEASIFLAFGTDNGCGGINDILCPTTSCCPACQTTLANYVQCFFDMDGDDNANCDIECASNLGGPGETANPNESNNQGGDANREGGNDSGDTNEADGALGYSKITIVSTMATAVVSLRLLLEA